MPREKASSVNKISMLSPRYIFGSKDHHSQFSPDSDEYDDAHTAGSKRIGLAWILVPLLFLLVSCSNGEVLVENYLTTTLLGLHVCSAFFFILYIGSVVWMNGGLYNKKAPASESVTYKFTVSGGFQFVKSYCIPLVLLLAAGIVRICLQFLFIRFGQCLIPGVEGLVPLVYTFWNNRWKRGNYSSIEDTQAFSGVFRHYYGIESGRDRKVAALLGFAVWIGSSMFAYPRSTVICESLLAPRIVVLQCLVVVLDVCILICVHQCLEAVGKMSVFFVSGTSYLFGTMLFVCGPLVLVFSSIFKLAPGTSIFANVDLQYIKTFAWTVSLVFIMLLVIGRSISSGRVMTCFIAMSSVYVVTSIFSALNNREEWTVTDYVQATSAIVALLYAFANDYRPRTVQLRSTQQSHQISNYLVYMTLLLLACITIFGLLPDNSNFTTVQEHPIDTLIYAADEAHEAWAAQAKQSQSLRSAATNYQKRYNRLPPPNFHVWYNFAIARNSDVLDDFDNIERDLAPFRALSPAELRQRTKEAANDKYNEVGLIKIRNGVAQVDTRFEGHSWMMDVMVLMMEYFMSSLPDMDIPFNINDESRVVVPFDEMQKVLARQPPPQATDVARNWSTNTGALLDEPLVGEQKPLFENWSFRNNFQKYSTVACPPTSPSRQKKSWLPSRLCVWCSQPHTVSHFVEDWNLAGNPCHQPDLATIHGFYQGPGAYKVTKKLLPVFSASKPQGYSDILYPSIWEWDEGQRARYAPTQNYPSPDYANKSNTLFWRGSTAEGFTDFGQWRTFTRQRLVYMNTNSTQSLSVYMPQSKGSNEYTFKHLNKEQLLTHPLLKTAGLTMDTRFTTYEKAWEDVMYEPEVFGTVETVDFQANWQHKYLMSMDEGSASKTFIPLVQSNSLPFRASIFREWFDDRIFAWKHFVPVDIRFHGLWSTVAYFAGGFGAIRSNEGLDAGEFIAQSGRLWGSRTLRREDMEIYFFRLLLEWGRLLDDQRDEIGFQL